MQASRRILLAGLGLGALAMGSPGLARAQHNPRHKLLFIFLRGGADPLSLVPPKGDPDYDDDLRPTSRLLEPGSNVSNRSEWVEIGDDFFALHEELGWLAARYRNQGDVAIINAVGAPTPSRSHFQVQAEIERAAWGTARGSGFLARYLQATASEGQSPLRGVGIGSALQLSLRGSDGVISMNDLADLAALPTRTVDAEALKRGLRDLHDGRLGQDGERIAGRLEDSANSVLDAMSGVADLAAEEYERPADYGDDSFGVDMALAARLIKEDTDTGTEVLSVDLGSWDTHDYLNHRIAKRAKLLNDGLAAFYNDLGDRADDVTVVIMSEFGRRLRENKSRGTDHGSGGCMFVLGRGVRGGIYGQWPGLVANPDIPVDIGGNEFRGDLMGTTDYRNVLADVLVGPMGLPPERLADVFPGLQWDSLRLATDSPGSDQSLLPGLL